MTLADRLIEEGRQEEGRTILRRQLTRRFGPLPHWAMERLNGASTAELEDWSEKLLDAPDLRAVFGQ